VRLRDAFSTRSTRRRYVRALFATIADRYDLITVVLSGGRDRRWKRRLADLAAPRPRSRALDLACGTGDIAFELAARGVRVVGLDVTSRMVTLARTKAAMRSDLPAQPAFLVGDMMALPFADQAFDLVTAGYGLRNAPELAPALHEALRVLRPGGRLLSLDFNRPDHPVVRRVYLTWLTLVGSVLGFLLHRDPDTYRYIPESIRRYPGASQVVQHLQRAGFAEVAWHPVLGGLMAIHTATRPLSGG